jgi:hypothetical protein
MYNSYDLSRNSVSGSAMKGKRKPFYCPSYYVQSEQREKELKNDGRWNPFFFFLGGVCKIYNMHKGSYKWRSNGIRISPLL